MKKVLGIACSVFVLFGLTASVKATKITYDLTDLGSGKWRYDYTVLNDWLSDPIKDFIVYFPEVTEPSLYNTYASLTEEATPADWVSYVGQPSAINLCGYTGWYTLGVGIPSGSSLGGFAASFEYSGSVPLGSQYFEVYDAGLNVVDSGRTQQAVHGVPEQSASITYVMLAALFLAGIGIREVAKDKKLVSY